MTEVNSDIFLPVNNSSILCLTFSDEVSGRGEGAFNDDVGGRADLLTQSQPHKNREDL